MAGFLALLVAPSIWRRAVYLTRKRIEGAVPLTANELQADKDKQRAEHAMALRRVEMNVEKLRAKSTLDAQRIVGQSEEIKLLKAEAAAQAEVNAQLERSLESANEGLEINEAEALDLKLQLSTTSAELAARTGQLESLGHLHQEAEKKIEINDRRLTEFESDIAKLKETVADLREKRRKDQQKVRDIRAEGRATAELLKNEKSRAAENDKKHERVVSEMSDMEVKLARREKAAARSKEKEAALKADLQELETRLADGVAERKILEKELAELTVRFNKIAKTVNSDDPDRAIAAMQVAQAKMELDLKSIEAERDRLKDQLSKQSATAKTAAALTSKAGGARGNANGDAALRDELAQLAAEVVHMTALVEGKESRIHELIKNASESDGSSPSLASRVKALKQQAEKANS